MQEKPVKTKRNKSNEKFQKAVKVASEAFKQIKATTTLDQWQDASDGDEKITWRHVWYHVMSMSLKGLIRVVFEQVKKLWGLMSGQKQSFEFVTVEGTV